ncbi:MAG: HK97 family phage prohead protease [Candidatus Thermoplasmatota archaeon]|nr:HK97 family phage prohead protease [Syntrophales bacterium]MDD5502449.1 HK97 family phage prohead protease [Candidatus Thermoplasmatota archaeon]
MPFGDYEDFDDCVAQNQDKDDPEAYCAWLHYVVTGRWPGEGGKQEITLPLDVVEKICPPCAEKMKALNIKELKVFPVHVLKGLYDDINSAKGGDSQMRSSVAMAMECMDYKTFKPQKTQLKVYDSEDGAGYVEGYASVFGNVDYDKEVVEKGAFTKTLAEGLPGRKIKFVDFHNAWMDSDFIIGVVEEAHEDEHGLWFKARFSSVRRAQDVRTKIKEGILDALSIGYDVIKDRMDNETGIRYLTELKLYEISIVSWGANPIAATNNIKSMLDSQLKRITRVALELKEGRILSENNIGLLREAINALQALLNSAEPEKSTQKEQEPPPVKTDETEDLLSGIDQASKMFGSFNDYLKELKRAN